MSNRSPARTKLDQQLEAEPIVVGARTIRPVARMVGWQLAPADDAAPSDAAAAFGATMTFGAAETFGAAAIRLTPLHVTVQDEDGEHRVSMADPMRGPLLGIAMAGALVSAVCALIMVAVRRLARRRSRV